MKINTALILCAGFGKRLNPITLDKPKPLLELKNITLLENTINLIKQLGIKEIILNTFYLKNQIKDFINKKEFNISIKVIDEGDQILNTGGGILNMINNSREKNFLIFNPDTLWHTNYLNSILEMEEHYQNNDIKNILLVANKKLSFDQSLKGDFNLDENKLSKNNNNHYIYTGCQIFNRQLLNSISNKSFSITLVWNDLIKKNILFGFESKNKFYHISNLEIYNKLLINN
tara:strand:+ start:1579 stop:2271 length:693 start_codon:yes stop_codon:yes gene_type:complete